MASFETRDEHDDPALRPLRVAVRREDLFREARELVADLAAWKLVRADEALLVLHCERAGGPLGGKARITVTVSGPDDLPSAELRVTSQTSGLLTRDKANVREFVEHLRRRVG